MPNLKPCPFCGGKPYDCPLQELPPHGRLIDENAIKAWFDEWYDPNVEILVWQLIDEIKNVPTVIPADKDGET